MEHNETQKSIDLAELWNVFVSNIWTILIVGLVAFGIVAGVSIATYQAEYTSTGTVYLISQKANSSTSPTASDFSLALNTVNDCTRTFKSHHVLDAVIEKLAMPITYEQLSKMIDINNPQSTRYLEISVTAHNPNDAKIIVDTLCEIGAVSIVEIMGVDQVNIVDNGTLSDTPSNSKVPLMCFVIGLATAVVVYVACLLRYMFDDRINTPDDMEKFIGLSVLGVIPSSGDRSGKKYAKYSSRYEADTQNEEGVQ